MKSFAGSPKFLVQKIEEQKPDEEKSVLDVLFLSNPAKSKTTLIDLFDN